MCALFSVSGVFAQSEFIDVCIDGVTVRENYNAHYDNQGNVKRGHEDHSVGPCDVDNTAPEAVNKAVTTDQDVTVVITLEGSDADGDL